MKYAALGGYLRSLPGTAGDVTLRLGKIEKLIGAKLPKSAHTYREWWPIRMAVLARRTGGRRDSKWTASMSPGR